MGPVEAAVRSDLAAMGAAAQASALGASAVDLGRRQDQAQQPNQAAQVAKELRETLKRMGELWPPAPEADELDELRNGQEGA